MHLHENIIYLDLARNQALRPNEARLGKRPLHLAESSWERQMLQTRKGEAVVELIDL